MNFKMLGLLRSYKSDVNESGQIRAFLRTLKRQVTNSESVILRTRDSRSPPVAGGADVSHDEQ